MKSVEQESSLGGKKYPGPTSTSSHIWRAYLFGLWGEAGVDLLLSRAFGFHLNLDIECLKRGGHFWEAECMRDWGDGLLLVRGRYRPRRWSGVAASLRHVLIVDGDVLTPILTREIKFKFKFILLTVLVPGCRGNYVPLGFKANLQPLTPLWNYWPLGPYQQKIN